MSMSEKLQNLAQNQQKYKVKIHFNYCSALKAVFLSHPKKLDLQICLLFFHLLSPIMLYYSCSLVPCLRSRKLIASMLRGAHVTCCIQCFSVLQRPSQNYIFRLQNKQKKLEECSTDNFARESVKLHVQAVKATGRGEGFERPQVLSQLYLSCSSFSQAPPPHVYLSISVHISCSLAQTTFSVNLFACVMQQRVLV